VILEFADGFDHLAHVTPGAELTATPLAQVRLAGILDHW